MTIFSIRALPATLALFVVTVCGANAASADDGVHNNDIRLGSYTVFYHALADDLAGPYVPPGVNFHTDNLETLYIGYIRTFSTHFSAELAMGWPPLTKTEGRGPASLGSVPYDGQVISTARWFAPTALLEYTFFEPSAKLRPFIGFGVNYTNFYDRTSTGEGNAASGGPTKLSLPASWGPAVTAGLSYRLADRWHLYGSWGASKVNTRLTANTGGIVRTTHIEFNPQTLVISIGYAF
jgi:outer membrane protein